LNAAYALLPAIDAVLHKTVGSASPVCKDDLEKAAKYLFFDRMQPFGDENEATARAGRSA
jgi:hypothetical protein